MWTMRPTPPQCATSCMEQTEQNPKKLSVVMWHEMRTDENSIPLCTTVSGVSMMPLIRKGRDVIVIHHVKRPLERGDIVLFRDPIRDRYVLHRLWDIAADRALTWGDNCMHPDGWMRLEMIWGIAVAMRRGKRMIRFESNAARKMGIALAKQRHLYCRAKNKAYRAALRLPAPIKSILKKVRNTFIRV